MQNRIPKLVTKRNVPAQIQQLRSSYAPEAEEMARGMQRDADIEMPYQMQWAIAKA